MTGSQVIDSCRFAASVFYKVFDMKKIMLCVTAAVALATSSPAMAAFVVDTGTPTNVFTNYFINPGESLGGFFTLGTATTVTAVEGFINGDAGSNISVTIYGNGNLPATVNTLYSANFNTVDALLGAWQGVFGQSWNLSAGSYWVGFSSNRLDGMFASAPNPLSAYARTSQGAWFPASNDMTLGVRISDGAQVVAVPEPATWGMMLLGFGLVGGAMRRHVTKISYA